jgi:hypothetical protein
MEDDNDLTLYIEDMDKFIEETYLFSMLNLDIAMLPEVNMEKDPIKRSELKMEILSEFTIDMLNKSDTDEMRKMYPVEKAKALIQEKVQYTATFEKEPYINYADLEVVVETISRAMLYCVFDSLHKEGVVDLFWDDKSNDFKYGLKKGTKLDAYMAKVPKRYMINEKKKVTKKKPVVKKVTKRKKK